MIKCLFCVWRKSKMNFRLLKIYICAKKLLILNCKPFKLKFGEMLKLRNQSKGKSTFQHFDI